MKIVLDTNVLLSGLAFPKSVPGTIVTAWHEHRLQIVLSEYQLDEITRVLNYPKIRKLLKWDEERIETFKRQIKARSLIVDVANIEAVVPRDAGDSPILAALIAGGADFLVTGDGDLHALRERYAIETPAEFVRRL